jgi:hypothetical protein
MIYEEKLKGNCFVYINGNEVDIEKYYELVRLSKDGLIILYPERSLTFVDTVCYIPFVKSVITENPWIIATYDRKYVWIIEDNIWVNPEIQTFGSSVNIITDDILKYRRSIPLCILYGKKGIEKYKEEVKLKKYDKF